MASEAVSVKVDIALVLPGAPAEELDRVTRTIRRELSEQRVERVELVHGDASASDTKGTDPVTLGALALVVLPAVLPKIVTFLQQWTGRKQSLVMKLKLVHQDRSIEVELPLAEGGPERLQAFIEAAKQAIAD
jgi:hypothetical protein